VEIVEKNVYWTSSEDLPDGAYLLKVFVVPPRHVDVTVLPCRFGKDARLLFSLCR
jgi:hypothetical protein